MTVIDFLKNNKVGGCYRIHIVCRNETLYEGLAQDFRRLPDSALFDRKICGVGAEVYKPCEGLYEGCILIRVWQR